jgi:hypothetical protein
MSQSERRKILLNAVIEMVATAESMEASHQMPGTVRTT